MEDTRCCGSGTCIINAKCFCWCGQRWDGTRMCFAEAAGSERQDEAAKLKASADDGQDQA